MHFNPQLFKVSIIQSKLFSPLGFELSRFHCNYHTVRLAFSKLLGKVVVKYVPIYILRIHLKKKDQHQMMLVRCIFFFFFFFFFFFVVFLLLFSDFFYKSIC